MYGNDSALANFNLCEEQDKLSCPLPHCSLSPFLNPTFVWLPNNGSQPGETTLSDGSAEVPSVHADGLSDSSLWK